MSPEKSGTDGCGCAVAVAIGVVALIGLAMSGDLGGGAVIVIGLATAFIAFKAYAKLD